MWQNADAIQENRRQTLELEGGVFFINRSFVVIIFSFTKEIKCAFWVYVKEVWFFNKFLIIISSDFFLGGGLFILRKFVTTPVCVNPYVL